MTKTVFNVDDAFPVGFIEGHVPRPTQNVFPYNLI